MQLIVVTLYLALCVLAFLFCRAIWRAPKHSPAEATGMNIGGIVVLGSAIAGDGTSFDSSVPCPSGHAGSFDAGDGGCSSH